MRKLAFYFGLAFVFVVFGVLPELMYYITGMNTYLIYWVAPAAILGAVINRRAPADVSESSSMVLDGFFRVDGDRHSLQLLEGRVNQPHLRLCPGVPCPCCSWSAVWPPTGKKSGRFSIPSGWLG